MAILFYDHLFDRNEIHIHIDQVDAPDEKKSKLKQMVDDILHSKLVHFILDKLPSKKHKTFLSKLEHSPYDPQLIDYLKEHIDEEIETQIQQEFARIEKLILKDIRGE